MPPILLEQKLPGICIPAEESLAHDADGNLTGDWRWSYEWDEENRLSAAHPSQAAVTAALAQGLAGAGGQAPGVRL